MPQGRESTDHALSKYTFTLYTLFTDYTPSLKANDSA